MGRGRRSSRSCDPLQGNRRQQQGSKTHEPVAHVVRLEPTRNVCEICSLEIPGRESGPFPLPRACPRFGTKPIEMLCTEHHPRSE